MSPFHKLRGQMSESMLTASFIILSGGLQDAYTYLCRDKVFANGQTGNMTPSFRVMPDGTIRPVYLYAVDAAEFVVNKLLDRGSLSATTMVTNVQDFIGKVAGGLGLI